MIADLRIESSKDRKTVRVAVYIEGALWFSYWVRREDVLNGNIVASPSQFIFEKMRQRLLGEVVGQAKKVIVVQKKKVIIRKKGQQI